MLILRTPEEMHAACLELKRAGRRLGFVPTMGALHDGHLSLVRAARARCQAVAVSIFVNPLQFGPSEDLARYPRTFERDCQLLEAEQVDLLFAPSSEDMYAPGAKTVVEVQDLSGKLCGRSRPGHFRGVTTVVAKLFSIVVPEAAFFGQKDAAQATILRRMVRDLNFDIEIVVCPIVREKDGLAMSSRNAYLSPVERQQALVLRRALLRLEALAEGGERRASRLIEAAHEVFRDEPEVRLDYIEIVNNETLDPVEDVSGGALVAVAAFVGATRLIDNVLLPGVAQARGPNASSQ